MKELGTETTPFSLGTVLLPSFLPPLYDKAKAGRKQRKKKGRNYSKERRGEKGIKNKTKPPIPCIIFLKTGPDLLHPHPKKESSGQLGFQNQPGWVEKGRRREERI